MRQSRSSGFFPIIDAGPWALLIPIQISQDLLLINIICQNEYINKLFKDISSFTENFRIIGMTDVDKLDNLIIHSGDLQYRFQNLPSVRKILQLMQLNLVILIHQKILVHPK